MLLTRITAYLVTVNKTIIGKSYVLNRLGEGVGQDPCSAVRRLGLQAGNGISHRFDVRRDSFIRELS